MENNTNSTRWSVPPAPIPDSKITREYVADVVVLGLGNAGTPAVRAAAEAGASVIGIEKMELRKYNVWGSDVGHINSDFLASKGIPRVDPLKLFNEWMRRSGNRANPKLVMQFCQKSGEAFNWFTEPFTREQLNALRVEYWPLGKNFTGEITGQKFWAGTAQFAGIFNPKSTFGLLDAIKANQECARENGAKLHFGMDAQQLILGDNRVVGVIAKNLRGQYVKFNANNGIILAAGDFGGNKEMCRDLLFDIVDVFDKGDDFRSAGRDGRGIQMGVWAGGRLEARPIAAMGGNHYMFQSVIRSFGTLWVDDSGKRYCNEGFGDPVFAGFPAAQEKRGKKFIVFDSSIFEDLQSSPPAHTSFFINDEDTEQTLKEQMAAAREAGAEG